MTDPLAGSDHPRMSGFDAVLLGTNVPLEKHEEGEAIPLATHGHNSLRLHHLRTVVRRQVNQRDISSALKLR
jgi:hypothetical protein